MEVTVPEKTEEEKKEIQSTLGSFTGIYVDIYEPDWAYESLTKDKGLLVKKVHLEVGDYAFSNIGIERKDINDYFNSLTSGRLWKQMINLKTAYEKPILAIENLKDPMVQLTGILNIRFSSSIARIVKMGITVVTLPTHAHFLGFVQYLYLSSDKKLRYRPVPRKQWGRAKLEIKEDMLTMIPGIGRKTAMAILARYPTIEELTRLSVADLVQNTPLGPKKSKALWEVLHT